MKGRRQVKEGFLSLETIETWIQRANEQDKSFKGKNCNATGFFMLNSFLCVSRMFHHTTTSRKLDTTVESIGILI